MNEADLKKLVEAARARYAAMSPSDKLRRDYMQRRSFVRGMCPWEKDYTEWCEYIDKTLPHEMHLTDAEIGLILAGSK